MIWLTWRQSRAQAITAGAILLALAIVLAITGASLASDYNSAGLNTCHLSCPQDATNLLAALRGGALQYMFYGGILAMYLAPALIGLFWGAPLLARELETGTYRLAWNQSVTRDRWTLIKLGAGGLASVAVAGLLSLMISWWATPIDTAESYGGQGLFSNRMTPLLFGARGITPLGYAAFAFVLGVTLGVLLRRAIPAMALTLLLFAAVQLLVPTLIRPHLLPADQASRPLNPYNTSQLSINQNGQMTVQDPASIPGAWLLSNETVTPAGHVFTGPAGAACAAENSPVTTSTSMSACAKWLSTLHLRQVVTYQPASRFWPLQWTEAAIYLVASAGLGGICVWRIRRWRA
jgi:ABC-type transport system involved in multi-copper enzyme maturation permease subunit